MPTEQFEFADYGVFSDAVGDAKNLNEQIETGQNNMRDIQTILGDPSVFMGPICDITMEGMQDSSSKMQINKQNFETIAEYIQTASSNYKEGDQSSSNLVLQANAEGKLTIAESNFPALVGNTNADQVYNYLIAKGFTPAAAAGIMGNLQAESGFLANNVQNGMGYSDDDYVAGIKSGAISRESFINDARGFGIAQWTFSTRKAALYDYLGPQNIDSLSGQLDFMVQEMGGGLTSSLNASSTPAQAAATFHNVYEKSADASTAGRENNATNIYRQYNA